MSKRRRPRSRRKVLAEQQKSRRLERLESREMFAGDTAFAVELPGDFNLDGIVNAADYSVWRDSVGGPESLLNGNGEDTGLSAGIVDDHDYGLWKSNFGMTESVALERVVSGVTEVIQSGTNQLSQLAPEFVSKGLGKDLPVVYESLAEELGIGETLKEALAIDLSGGDFDAIREQFEGLRESGFELEYLGTLVDEQGDFLRVTFEQVIDTDAVDFTVLGKTGFDYFDEQVNGKLGGSIQGDSPTVRVRFTFGVDNAGGSPNFYVSESSTVNVDGLSAAGEVGARMAIRFLSGVEATGRFTAELSGGLTLRDSDGDGKLRLHDLGRADAVVGDIDGHIELDVDFRTDLPVLNDLAWGATWTVDLADGWISEEFDTPDAGDVLAGVLTSFVDMKEDFEFLAPVADALAFELPGIGTTVGELTGAGDRLGWLAQGANSVTAAKEELRRLGITVADIDAETVLKLVNGERVDLVSFHQSDAGVLVSESLEYPLAVAPVGGVLALTVSGTLEAELGWEYAVGFGVDTTGVWIDPNTRLGLSGGVSAGVEAELSIAGLFGVSLGAGAGAQVFAGLGLRDPYVADGRIYMDEVWLGAEEDTRSLGEAILDVIDVDMRIDAQGYVRAELELPWPLPDIMLVDESFNLGAILSTSETASQTESLREVPLPGQGSEAPPAVLGADGKLVLTGGAESDYVELAQDGERVLLRWAGYEDREYGGVTSVEFHGNGSNDYLDVAGSFSLPITAFGGDGDDLIVGGDGNDTLHGGAGDDRIFGRGGDDRIEGGADNDRLDGGQGADHLLGGDGDDTLHGEAGADRIEGGAGADLADGGAGDDLLFGQGDDDSLEGGSGADEIHGGDGRDFLAGKAGDDRLFGGRDADAIDGGTGDDYAAGGEGADLVSGGAGDDELYGQDGDDTLMGGDGADLVRGGRGNDLIQGGAGDDTLIGSTDSDNVIDEQDRDTILGGDGDDTLLGGRGADTLNGQAGADIVDGESGQDVIVLDLTTSSGSVVDNLSGGLDRDQLWITPAYQPSSDLTDERDKLLSTAFNERAAADGEEVDLDKLQGEIESLAVAGTGDNHLVLTQIGLNDFEVEQFDPVTGELVSSIDFVLSGDADTDLEIITIAGMDGDDLIEVSESTTQDVYLDGGDGDDVLIGGSGRDVIKGGAGNDVLRGRHGADELHGGNGADTLLGEAGTDRLYGGAGNDHLNGGEGSDVQFGGAGDDTLEAGAGLFGDVMYGDSTDSADAGNDTIIGGAGRDAIFGGGGDDILHGGALTDIIMGELGNDEIEGGSGADFIFGGGGDDEIWSFDDDAALDEAFAEMNWGLFAAELDDAHDNLRDEFWAADEQARAIDMLDGSAEESKRARQIDSVTEEGIAAAQQALEEAKSQVADLLQQIEAGTAEGSVDRQLQYWRTVVQAFDELDGIRAASEEHAAIDPERILSLDRLQSRMAELKPMVADLSHATQFASEQLAQIPSEYQGASTDLVDGGSDDDILHGTVFAETMIGGDGNDTIYHSGGDDVIVGGEGELDEYAFVGTDADDHFEIVATQLDDSNLGFIIKRSEGQSDSDAPTAKLSIEQSESTAGGDDQVTALETDIEVIRVDGGDGNDTLKADFGVNARFGVTFDGGDGDDVIDVSSLPSPATLIGGDGDDDIFGGHSDDSIDGGAGNDELHGGGGRDAIDGGDGADDIDGGEGEDTINGGSGNDAIHGGGGNDTIDGGRGSDSVGGGDGNDTIRGGLGSDYLDGGAGDDVFEVASASEGDNAQFDHISGGEGHDTLRNVGSTTLALDNVGDTVRIDELDGNGQKLIGNASSNLFDFRGVRLTNVSRVETGEASDTIYTSDQTANVTYDGGARDDTIYGQDLPDILVGGEGNDRLIGGAGLDTLDGGLGTDSTTFDPTDTVRQVEAFDGRSLYVAQGRTFVLNTDRHLYSSTGSHPWKQESRWGVRDVEIAQGTIFALADNGGVYRYNGAAFDANPVSGYDVVKTWVHGDRLRVLANHGNINEFDRHTGVWSHVGPSSRQPLMMTNAGWFMHSHDGAVYSFQQNNNSWKRETGHDIAVAVHNHGTVYVMTKRHPLTETVHGRTPWGFYGEVWKFTGGAFQQISGNDIVHLWVDGGLIRVRAIAHFDAYDGSSWGN